MQLRDDRVLVVARVPDQRPPRVVARQVAVAQQQLRPGRLRVPVVEVGLHDRPGAVDGVEVEARGAEVDQRVRVRLAVEQRRRVERDVVVDELREVGEPRRDGQVLLQLRPELHRRDEVVERLAARLARRAVREHAAEAPADRAAARRLQPRGCAVPWRASASAGTRGSAPSRSSSTRRTGPCGPRRRRPTRDRRVNPAGAEHDLPGRRGLPHGALGDVPCLLEVHVEMVGERRRRFPEDDQLVALRLGEPGEVRPEAHRAPSLVVSRAATVHGPPRRRCPCARSSASPARTASSASAGRPPRRSTSARSSIASPRCESKSVGSTSATASRASASASSCSPSRARIRACDAAPDRLRDDVVGAARALASPGTARRASLVPALGEHGLREQRRRGRQRAVRAHRRERLDVRRAARASARSGCPASSRTDASRWATPALEPAELAQDPARLREQGLGARRSRPASRAAGRAG